MRMLSPFLLVLVATSSGAGDSPGSGMVTVKALDRFAHASFRVREKVIDGCAHTAFADRSVSIEEADLLRVVGFTLDCPLPPFLKGKAA